MGVGRRSDGDNVPNHMGDEEGRKEREKAEDQRDDDGEDRHPAVDPPCLRKQGGDIRGGV